ncbi:hypothetical protein OIU77_030533 [Salix suchowensis]|uniref:Uncharacterized protein n=1 Tax=Salix suchowensis TaxID=1278906 RepID=A0ABQ9BEC8_9ROSI|nr:hypothetical protein OIU77_030533 [Salix suchowensis]
MLCQAYQIAESLSHEQSKRLSSSFVVLVSFLHQTPLLKYQLKTWIGLCAYKMFQNGFLFINSFLLFKIPGFDFSLLFQYPFKKVMLLIFRHVLPFLQNNWRGWSFRN